LMSYQKEFGHVHILLSLRQTQPSHASPKWGAKTVPLYPLGSFLVSTVATPADISRHPVLTG
jgi:hypothetical protein